MSDVVKAQTQSPNTLAELGMYVPGQITLCTRIKTSANSTGGSWQRLSTTSISTYRDKLFGWLVGV